MGLLKLVDTNVAVEATADEVASSASVATPSTQGAMSAADAASTHWEKVALWKELLPRCDENSLLISSDTDVLWLGDADITTIMPKYADIGMVRLVNRGSAQPHNWYNSGVVALRNTAPTRDWLELLWQMRKESISDEIGMSYIGFSFLRLFPLDHKWNCWQNNLHMVETPVARSFHGVVSGMKLDLMKAYLNERE